MPFISKQKSVLGQNICLFGTLKAYNSKKTNKKPSLRVKLNNYM
jgi:hypothetical protein